MPLLPPVVQQYIDQPCWWRGELVGLHVLAGLANCRCRTRCRLPEDRDGPIDAVAVLESGSYLGPGAEIRRCLLLSEAEVAHTSYVGHSVLGRKVRLGAFFCGAVRNLRRGTVHMLSDGALVDTGEVTPAVSSPMERKPASGRRSCRAGGSSRHR